MERVKDTECRGEEFDFYFAGHKGCKSLIGEQVKVVSAKIYKN